MMEGDEVKMAAHYVADMNTNDGVLKVLKELLLSFENGKDSKL